eukprot:gene7362-11684_t
MNNIFDEVRKKNSLAVVEKRPKRKKNKAHKNNLTVREILNELPTTEIKIIDSDTTIIKKYQKLSDILIQDWFVNHGKITVDTFLETKSKKLVLECEFNLEMVAYVNRALKLNHELTHLCLYGKSIWNNESNELGTIGAEYLKEGLKFTTALETLIIGQNYIDDIGMKYISEGLDHVYTLTSLQFDRNGFGIEGAKYLGDVIKNNQKLKDFVIFENKIKDEGVKYICESLESNSDLINLTLGELELSSESAKSISTMLKNKKSLKKLFLEYNFIGDKGIQLICDGLKENSSLEHLDLSANDIHSNGAETLSKAIEKMPLKSLNIFKNNIEDIGLAFICKFLLKTQTLTFLDLSLNYFGSAGLNHFTEALKQNTSLRTVLLDSNYYFDENSILKLCDVLKANFSIQRLTVEDSYDDEIYPDTENIIKQIINSNQNVAPLHKNTTYQKFILDLRHDVIFHFETNK